MSSTIVRKKGTLVGGGKGVGCEGEVELLQDGVKYSLRFKQLMVWDDSGSSDMPLNVGLFVSDVKLKPKKASKPTIKNFESKVWPQAFEEGLTAEDDAGSLIEGLLPPCAKPSAGDNEEDGSSEEEPETSALEITQEVDPEEWPENTALDIQSVLFAKLVGIMHIVV